MVRDDSGLIALEQFEGIHTMTPAAFVEWAGSNHPRPARRPSTAWAALWDSASSDQAGPGSWVGCQVLATSRRWVLDQLG